MPIENRKLIDAIQAPEEHAELISTIIEGCRGYGRQKGYSPIMWNPVADSKYFCAYKQGAAARGREQQSSGLRIVGKVYASYSTKWLLT